MKNVGTGKTVVFDKCPVKNAVKEIGQELLIEGIKFQRSKNGIWQYGIMLNNDQLMIDMNGKPVVGQVYNYERCSDLTLIYKK